MSSNRKQVFAATLKEIMQTKSFDKVTVTELVEQCGVKRQTFYYHFKDLYSLLEWIYITEVDQIIGRHRTMFSWHEGLYKLCRYLQDNAKFVEHTYYSVNHIYLEYFLYTHAYDLIRPVVDENKAHQFATEHEKDTLANFYKYAFVGFIIDWIAKGMRDSPEEVVHRITQSMKMISSDVALKKSNDPSDTPLVYRGITK